jgi:GR25 family glycosyltransferase involved in LPS biosynthesis
MKKLVISINNEIGKKRRLKLNYEFIHIEGIIDCPLWIKNNFRFYHNENINSKKTIGKINCFASHIKALEYIVDNKLNDVVILEDDAILDGNIIDLPNDGACLLGATLRHPTNWNKDNDFRKNEVHKIISNFKKGINEIDYKKYRWNTAHSIYYPNWEIAKQILDFIKSKKYKFKHFDLFLSTFKLIKYLHYPSIYNHDDRDSISQINSKNKNVFIKDYIIQN